MPCLPPREQYSLVYTILAESKGLLGAGGGGGGRRRRAGRHLRSGSGGRVESMVSGMYNVLTSSFLREVCKVKPRLELQTRGKYDEAEPLYREAMEAWRRSARPSAIGMSAHTCGLHQQPRRAAEGQVGDLAAAEPLYREALEGKRETPAVGIRARSPPASQQPRRSLAENGRPWWTR